jgi:hypothetical protein
MMRTFSVMPAIAAFLGIAAVVVSAFFGYHAWNISVGLTGNDRHKLSQLKRVAILQVCRPQVWRCVLCPCCQLAYALFMMQAWENARKGDTAGRDTVAREQPNVPSISYSRGIVRNWLEVMHPLCIAASGSRRVALAAENAANTSAHDRAKTD